MKLASAGVSLESCARWGGDSGGLGFGVGEGVGLGYWLVWVGFGWFSLGWGLVGLVGWLFVWELVRVNQATALAS